MLALQTETARETVGNGYESWGLSLVTSLKRGVNEISAQFGYNPAALSRQNFPETTNVAKTHRRDYLDRSFAVLTYPGPIKERQRSTRAHSQGRSEQFSNHEDRAHADGRLRSAADRVAESQTRGGVGSEADDCVGTLERTSRALGFWPRWLAQRTLDGAHDLPNQRRAHLRSPFVDAQHTRAGDGENVSVNSAGSAHAGSVDSIL